MSLGPRPGPRLHRAHLPGPEPLRRRPGRALRRPQRLPGADVDAQRLRRSAGPALRHLLHRGQGARHPPAGHRGAGRRARRRRGPARRGEGDHRRQGRRGRVDAVAPRVRGPRGRRLARRLSRDAASTEEPAPVVRARLGPRRRRRAVRHGPGRQVLRLRCRRPQLLRLLRPDHDGLGARPASRCRTPRAPSTAAAPRSRPRRCSPATWSSTTARSATSACTSATARSCTPPTPAPACRSPA